jgi:hypothetical protein
MGDSGVEENAAERKFGPEFDDIHILSNAQVAVILQVSAGQAMTNDEELNDVYRKTQKYVERFNQMANKEKDHQGKFVRRRANPISQNGTEFSRSIRKSLGLNPSFSHYDLASKFRLVVV